MPPPSRESWEIRCEHRNTSAQSAVSESSRCVSKATSGYFRVHIPTTPDAGDIMGAMDEIREGMRVLGADGAEVGTVEDLKVGNPDAATADGQTTENADGLFEDLVEGLVGSGSEVSDEQRERLLRLGYIKVDRKGILKGDLFVAADDIGQVSGDSVRLTFIPE